MSTTSSPTRSPARTVDLREPQVGRWASSALADRPLVLRALPRPTLGGRAFLRTYLAARALGRVHPRLARRALLRLWLTPWVHPSARRPVEDIDEGFGAWALPAEGTTLRGYAGGAGPTAVLVHGWASRGADWRHLAHDLVGAGWRVVVPDLPAHGMTPGRRTDLYELGRALAAVLEHERPSAVVVHSMGFPTLLRALEEGAGEPAAIVALAPGRKIARALDGFAARARLGPALHAELRRGLEHRYGQDAWDALDADRVVAHLSAEGLVIHDSDDEDVPVSDGRFLAQAWPGARFTATEGLGHRRILRDASVRALVVRALS